MRPIKNTFIVCTLTIALAACGGTNPPPGGDDAGTSEADAGGGVCPTATGPTNHAATTITGAQEWTAEGSPHVVTGNIVVKGGTLTIRPCATVELTPDTSITVESDGKLIAEGAADKAITIDATDPTKPWTAINIAGTASLAHATIKLGGKGSPMVVVSGTSALKVDNVTLSDSFNYGLELRDSASFDPAAKALTIKNCGDGLHPHPLIINPHAISTVPDIVLKGNRTNAIKIKTAANISVTSDQTLRNRGVPYDVGGAGDSGMLLVASGNSSAPATLTIEPGVTMRFARDAKLVVEDPGADPTSVKNATGILIASTTADKPISLTSAEDPKQPGDWGGVIFGGRPNANNRLENVTIAWAGGTTATFNKLGCNLVGGAVRGDAAVVLPFEPPAAFMKNSVIQHSAAHGIARAWAGAANVSFLADTNNSFSDIAGCNETTPKLTDGTCPSDPPCPK